MSLPVVTQETVDAFTADLQITSSLDPLVLFDQVQQEQPILLEIINKLSQEGESHEITRRAYTMMMIYALLRKQDKVDTLNALFTVKEDNEED